MTDRPQLYSAPMVRALIEGRKTQTRRVLTPHNTLFNGRGWTKLHREQTWAWDEALVDAGPSPVGNPGPYLHLPWVAGSWVDDFEGSVHRIYPRVQPSDRLWVREAHYLTDNGDYEFAVYDADADAVAAHVERIKALPADFPADVKARHLKHRPGFHMPRWASRITLLVDQVRIEPLNDISEEDAIAEGISRGDDGWWGSGATAAERNDAPDPVEAYQFLWEQINGTGSWDANPWVIAITFRVVLANIDSEKAKAA